MVIDDAYNYLRLRSLTGKHWTVPHSPDQASNALSALSLSTNILSEGPQNPVPKLLVWSAADRNGITRIVEKYVHCLERSDFMHACAKVDFIHNLAYTLDTHRSHHSWRTFALVRATEELLDLHSHISSPRRASHHPLRVGFIFSGQGAQWHAMGRELLHYASFKSEINQATAYLSSTGCRWSVFGKIRAPKQTCDTAFRSIELTA